jgi:hypothetical protein
MTTSTPDLQDLLGPGQESIADSYLEELQQGDAQQDEGHPLDQAIADMQGEPQQGEQLLAGKFKSPQELEKAYLEAQKLISQRGQQAPEPDTQPELAPEQYTPELGKQLYGDTVSTAIEAAQINPLEMAQKVYAGEDVSPYVDALVEKGGLPRELVQTYLDGVRPAPAAQPAPAGQLSDVDVAEIKAAVGGDQEFARISQWAVSNLSSQDLADYNAAVDSGNKEAARFALKAMKSMAQGGAAREPELIGGGAAARSDVFESSQQAIDALNKRNEGGKRLYEVDPKYRAWYDKTMARSNPFG